MPEQQQDESSTPFLCPTCAFFEDGYCAVHGLTWIDERLMEFPGFCGKNAKWYVTLPHFWMAFKWPERTDMLIDIGRGFLEP